MDFDSRFDSMHWFLQMLRDLMGCCWVKNDNNFLLLHIFNKVLLNEQAFFSSLIKRCVFCLQEYRHLTEQLHNLQQTEQRLLLSLVDDEGSSLNHRQFSQHDSPIRSSSPFG